MYLVCRNCRSINQDPGGDPRQYVCGYCGQAQLDRVENAPSQSQTAVTAIAGAAIGGMIFGPFGALVGALVGAAVGEKVK